MSSYKERKRNQNFIFFVLLCILICRTFICIFVVMVQNSIDVLKSLQSETDKIKADLDALKKLTESKEKAQKKLELYQSIQVVQELAKVQFEREKDQNVKEKIAEVQSKVSDFSKEL